VFKNRTALAVSIVALIASVGGTAVAGSLLTGKDIANGSLTGKDIKNRSIAKKDLKKSVLKGVKGPKGDPGAPGAQGIQGPAGTPDGYTKTEADAAFLGKSAKAADAETVDGIDGDDLVAGDAGLDWGAVSRNENTAAVTLLDMGNIGTLAVQCGAAGSKTVSIVNATANALTVTRTLVVQGDPGSVVADTVAANDTEVMAGDVDNYQMTLQVFRPGANNFASADFTTVILSASDDGSACNFQAHAVNSEKDGTSLVIDG
jgi:hypothetical protein